MRRAAIHSLMILLLIVVQSCATVPHTQRKALILISPGQEAAMGEEAYREILSQEKLSENKKWVLIVDRVGRNLARVSDKPDLNWEFKLIESPQKNAFALPGGKVAVYTGIMEVAKNEAGLAAIMGHEIAHAIARQHETEADNIGTIYMARAGYDPNEAVALWERFAEAEQAGVPAFLSTHPASRERAEALRTIAQQAMAEYRRVPNPYGKGEPLF